VLLVGSPARAQTTPSPGDDAPPAAQAPPPRTVDPFGHADEGRGTDGIHWHARREYSTGVGDYVVTGAAAGVIVGTAVVPPRQTHWRGGIAFDEDVRDALRISNLYGRYAVRDMSDVGVSFASTWPFLVDALVTAWWYRGRADLAYNMALVSAEAFALAAAVQGTANYFGSRERPYGRLCGSDIPEKSVDCENSVRHRSFFSGHTTLGFTAAGLVCVNHLGLSLLGPAGDVATCASGIVVAATTSVFRIMSDMHYASDVAVGAVVGTLSGVLVPLLHLKKPGEGATGLDVRVAPVGQGLGITGTF
jgi:membrane-associated phospholipid phosphatase